jgi:hypothetical protein
MIVENDVSFVSGFRFRGKGDSMDQVSTHLKDKIWVKSCFKAESCKLKTECVSLLENQAH